MKEPMLEKIILKYKDGTEKEISKGVVINNSILENKECELEMEFANIKRTELENIVYAILQMGCEMGILDSLLEE